MSWRSFLLFITFIFLYLPRSETSITVNPRKRCWVGLIYLPSSSTGLDVSRSLSPDGLSSIRHGEDGDEKGRRREGSETRGWSWNTTTLGTSFASLLLDDYVMYVQTEVYGFGPISSDVRPSPLCKPFVGRVRGSKFSSYNYLDILPVCVSIMYWRELFTVLHQYNFDLKKYIRSHYWLIVDGRKLLLTSEVSETQNGKGEVSLKETCVNPRSSKRMNIFLK